jgi:hypothetical protein
MLAYLRHAQTYYKPDERGEVKEVGCIRDALRIVRQHFGTVPTAEFGPKSLKAVRAEMVGKGWSRATSTVRSAGFRHRERGRQRGRFIDLVRRRGMEDALTELG